MVSYGHQNSDPVYHPLSSSSTELPPTLPSAASAAWDFDVYVAPAYRLSRAFGRLWDAANEELRSEGVRWCHSRISAFNLSSIAVHEKLGARQVGWAGFLCLGGFQLMVSSLKPWVHVSRSELRKCALRPL